jgi:hypothetical protein
MTGRGKSQRSLDLVDAAHAILEEIQPASVRATCYKLFTLGFITSMAKSETNRVSTQLTWAREQNIIPWNWIVDESREPERISAWKDPAAYIEAVRRSYRRDRWTDQPALVEVWSEKATIGGVLAPVLQKYGITFRVMHGYGSTTAIHQVATESCEDDVRPLTALYLGDWDPSGLHMSEVDLPERLERYGGDVDLRRIALTYMDTAAGLPSFPAATKRGDPRYRWFVERYGTTCWELDALSPVVLREYVEGAILVHLDLDAWHRAAVAEAAECDSLSTILSKWPKSISRQARKCDPGARA